MKKLLSEFKDFAMKGNVIDMAVGIIIGAAFTAIVTSLVNNIITPLLGIILKSDFNKLSFNVGEAKVMYGTFITSVINFILIAFVLFLIIKVFQKASRAGTEQAEEAASEKTCPYCKTGINSEATRCPQCTSSLID